MHSKRVSHSLFWMWWKQPQCEWVPRTKNLPGNKSISEMAHNNLFYTERHQSNITAEKGGFSFNSRQVHSTCKNVELLVASGLTSHMIKEAELFTSPIMVKLNARAELNPILKVDDGLFFSKKVKAKMKYLNLKTRCLFLIIEKIEQKNEIHTGFHTEPRIVID